MNLKKSWILKILIFLFTLNSIYLFLYFSSHHHLDHSFFLPKSRRTLNDNLVPILPKTPQLPFISHHRSKPWPILPSYLPWSQNPNVSFRSCEAYFGNGFTRRIDIRNSSGGGGGWFRCYYSETLRSSICEGGRIRMNPDKIKVSRGGERLEDVIGREEETELPEFEEGAFDVEGGVGMAKVGEKLVSREMLDEYVQKGTITRHTMRVSREMLDEYVQKGTITRHTMRDLMASIRVVDDHEFQCEQWVEEPVLLVTRFEYANLFHTVTDWYSAYVASRVTGLPNRPHLIFVDGHCKAPLEDTWRKLFSNLRYAKNFSGPVCFRHAIFVPLGYETALFKGLSEDVNCYGSSASDLWQNPNDQKTARLSEFGEMVRAAFWFRVTRNRVKRASSSSSTLKVLFVRREDYLAHPRHGGKVESRLSNEAEVYDVLNKWASNHSGCNVNLVNGLFAHMPMKEQIQAIQEASVIIGAHGAGLTHIISATAGTEILEIISSEYMRPHFQLIAKWKGLKYHAINLAGSYADPSVVLDKLSVIMRSLGC